MLRTCYKAAAETLSYAHFPFGTAYCIGPTYIAYIFCTLDTRKYMAAQVYIWGLLNAHM